MTVLDELDDEINHAVAEVGRDAVHQHLRNYLESHKLDLRVCIGCGRVFAPKTARRRYCSDTCANRVRTRINMREMRARRKAVTNDGTR
jgi:uncharacterized OB-fold protein